MVTEPPEESTEVGVDAGAGPSSPPERRLRQLPDTWAVFEDSSLADPGVALQLAAAVSLERHVPRASLSGNFTAREMILRQTLLSVMRANHYASLMEEESERVCAERDSWKKEAEGFNAERASLRREARQAREEKDEAKVLLSSARSHVEKLEEDLKKAKLAASEALNKLEISDEEYRRFTEEVAQREEAHREELEAARTISSEGKGKIIDEYRASPQFAAAAGNYFKGQFESFLKGLVVELQDKAPTVNFREFVSLAPVFGFFDRRAEEAARRQAGSSSQAEVPPSGSSEPGQQEEVGGRDSAAPGPSGCPPDKDNEGDRPGPSSTPPGN